jgi:hypothetical protein
MRSARTVSTICLIGLDLFSTVSTAEQIYLAADFNDKVIDEPIGIGGAEVGEPMGVASTITAIVRDGPMGSPSLEIQDNHEWAGHADFELLGSAELTSGTVYVSADLWFDSLAEGENCVVKVGEQGSNQFRFAELVFQGDGSIRLLYGDTSNINNIGTFAAGSPYRIILEFDMDAGTFDVWLNGEQAEDDLAHEISERGIGRVRVGCRYDVDLVGHFYIDALSVTDYFQATACEEHSWGRLKETFR